jgi:hypothetical protein
MSPLQLETLRQLHSVRKLAQNDYHRCLADKALEVDRHEAEERCRDAVKAIEVYSRSL